MSLEIGNKVAVLDDVIKGIIVKINGKKITLKDQDGFLHEYYSSDLVKVTQEQSELLKLSNTNNKLLKEKIKQPNKQKTPFTKYRNEISLEVDLHIQKLRKSVSKMDNYEILSLQISVAKAKLDYCVRKKIPRIIFIHGVGEGVLKAELYKLLKRYNVTYQDASYKKYGLGATEVLVIPS